MNTKPLLKMAVLLSVVFFLVLDYSLTRTHVYTSASRQILHQTKDQMQSIAQTPTAPGKNKQSSIITRESHLLQTNDVINSSQATSANSTNNANSGLITNSNKLNTVTKSTESKGTDSRIKTRSHSQQTLSTSTIKTIIQSKLKPGMSWYWQLSGVVDEDFPAEVFDIDLFEASPELISRLKSKGKFVICYFNAGAYEPYRPDSARFPEAVLGKKMDGWEDERWLDVAHFEKFADIMLARLDLAKTKGCNGVEPNNIDGYQNETGFSISYADQLRYNRWLAREAHARGLKIGLKNNLDQADELAGVFDFAIVEECFEYNDCDKALVFISAGKPVFGVEYNLAPEKFCPKAKQMQLSWAKADPELSSSKDFILCK